MPPIQAGIFYLGPTDHYRPFGEGIRCVGGPVIRLPVTMANAAGEVAHSLDLSGSPLAGTIQAGDAWTFQYWYRDPAGGGATFNLTHALAIRFLP